MITITTKSTIYFSRGPSYALFAALFVLRTTEGEVGFEHPLFF